MVENFGRHLRHERELRGVPLEEISTSTKIPIRYLQALEDNEFEELPGEVFIKGYIRSIAKSIGSDEEELLAAYDESAGRRRLEEDEQVRNAEESQKHSQKKRARFSVVWGIILVVVVVTGIVFLGKDKNQNPNQQSDSASTSSVPTTTPAPDTELALNPEPQEENEGDGTQAPVKEVTADQETPEEPEKTGNSLSEVATEEPKKELAAEKMENPSVPLETKPASQAPSPLDKADENNIRKMEKDDIIQQSPPPSKLVAVEGQGNLGVVRGKPLELVIRVSDNAWFNLTVDESREEDFLLPAGHSKKFYADEKIRIWIGNRRATELKLNGVPLEIPESSNNVIRDFVVNAELIKGIDIQE